MAHPTRQPPVPGPQETVDPPVALTVHRAQRRRLLIGVGRTLLTPAIVLVLYYVLPLDQGFGRRTLLALVFGLLAVGVLVAWQARSILVSPHPALRAAESIALAAPLFLVLFAVVYLALSTTDPGSFSEPLSRTDSLYFVMTVFATVGFGDITPVTQLARVLVTVQMVGDLVVVGLVLRIFLTAVERGRRRSAGTQDEPPRN
jgi:hypothetical protein